MIAEAPISTARFASPTLMTPFRQNCERPLDDDAPAPRLEEFLLLPVCQLDGPSQLARHGAHLALNPLLKVELIVVGIIRSTGECVTRLTGLRRDDERVAQDSGKAPKGTAAEACPMKLESGVPAFVPGLRTHTVAVMFPT
jgi:hypothetical protein